MQQLSTRYFFIAFKKKGSYSHRNSMRPAVTAAEDKSLKPARQTVPTEPRSLRCSLWHHALEHHTRRGSKGNFSETVLHPLHHPCSRPISPQIPVHVRDKGPTCFSQNWVMLADHQGTVGFSNTLREAQELSQVCTIHTKQ